MNQEYMGENFLCVATCYQKFVVRAVKMEQCGVDFLWQDGMVHANVRPCEERLCTLSAVRLQDVLR